MYHSTLTRSKEENARWKERTLYKTEGFWTEQLFDGGWVGHIEPVGELLHFTEEDFMTT